MTITYVNKKTPDPMDEWEATWRPYLNPWRPKIAESIHFDGWGEEHQFVKNFNPRQVWTLVAVGDYGISIVSGFHTNNARSYFLTKKKRPKPKKNQPEAPITIEITPDYNGWLS
jgi:hypothetical protein